jgi:flagellin
LADGTYTFTFGGKSVAFTSATKTVQDLANYINDPVSGKGLSAYLSGGNLVVKDTTGGGNVTFDAVTSPNTLGAFANTTMTGTNVTNIYLSDSTSSGASTIGVTIGAVSKAALNYGGNNVDLTADTLKGVDDATSIASAKIALGKINQAIQNVAGLRGDIGAGINRLQSAVNVINNQSQNLSAAEDGIRAADIAQEVANMTKFSILNQTGISSLAQANQMQQSVLSLLK